MKRPPVSVRMYRGILGDCFLLTIGDPSGPRAERSHILIDCGVLQGVKNGKTRMREIVADIAETTKGELDAVVVTHEHFDHISGFYYAADLFAKVTIGALWFAWTENPSDEVAQVLGARFNRAHRLLASLRLAMRAGAVPDARDEDEEEFVGLAGFTGPLDGDFGVDAARGGRGSRRIYEQLRANARQVEYLYPGEVLPTPALHEGAPHLRVFTLGPPRDYEMLKKDLPSSGSLKETYATAHLMGTDGGDTESPFSPPYQWFPYAGEGDDGAAVPDWVRDHYVASIAPCRFADQHRPSEHSCDTDFECGRRQDYRRLDDMHALEVAGLALKLDSHTNNTSLVLAFELEPGGDILLFAADAQVGNWKSWEKLTYARRDTGEKVAATTFNLLARTRLYKVGHHGSHNATMKAQGLEKMTHPGLIAMIPTVEEIAAKQGRGTWKMPNPETFRALIRQTKGRILRGDLTLSEVRNSIKSSDFGDLVSLDLKFQPHRENENYCEVSFDAA